MHKCNGSHGNMVGTCSCGLFQSQSNSFSMLFSMPNQKSFDETDMYSFTSPSPSPSSFVDCTLSLGTPSTRLSEDDEKRIHHGQRSSGSCMANYCWNFLKTKNSPYAPQNQRTSRGNNGNTISYNSTNDPLLARRCANCDTTSTPLWRNGPRGPKSLCNACGIRFKKEERRATAANANTNGENSSGVADQHHGYYNNSWLHQTQTPKWPCYAPAANEFRFVEYGDQSSDNTGIPFLSWKLNVADRPGLVHDFTR